MKKLIVLSLLLALAGAVTGPTARADDTAPTPPTPAVPETPAPETPAPETPPTPTPEPEAPAPETPAPETPAPAAPATPAPTAPETPVTPDKPAPKATKPVEQQLNGRVVALDKAANTITLQVNNQSYVLQISESTKFVKAGREKGVDDLILGEEVTVTVALRETPKGRVEIVVVAVDLPAGTEAQGGGSSVPGAKIPPFVSLPNPANIGGQVRSPSN